MSKAKHKISPELILKLKEAACQRYGMAVSNTARAKELSANIYIQIKLNINYNTIRRLFEIIPNKTAPSLFTLDAIAKYVGYKNWDEFCARDFLHEKDILIDFVNASALTKPIDLKKLAQFSEKYAGQERFHSILNKLILIAASRKEKEFFKQFFIVCEKVFRFDLNANIIQLTEVWATIQFLAIQIKKSKALQKIAIEHYSYLPFNGNYYVEFCPDLDNINGYYGKLLDEYIKTKRDTQAFLFYNCMKFYGCYFKKSYKGYDKYYKNIISIQKYSGIYCIPIARKRVCEAVFQLHKNKFNENNFFKNVNNDLKYLKKRGDYFDHLTAYVTHVAQGLYWCKQYGLIKKIVENHFPKSDVNVGYHANNDWNDLKIYYSVALYYANEKEKASQFINDVSEMRFRASQNEITSRDYNMAKNIIRIT